LKHAILDQAKFEAMVHVRAQALVDQTNALELRKPEMMMKEDICEWYVIHIVHVNMATSQCPEFEKGPRDPAKVAPFGPAVISDNLTTE
jgi:hypothetical protein